MGPSFAYRNVVIASLAGFGLMSCASLEKDLATGKAQSSAASAMIDGFGLAPRALNAGECGLFVWTGTTRRFMLFVQDGARGALAGETAELELVPAVIPTGADEYGQFPTQIFRDEFENLYTLKFDTPTSMDQGLRYGGGTWRFETPDGWDKVIPVYGLSTCLPDAGIGGAIPVSNEVMREQDPYETKLRKLVMNLEKERAADRPPQSAAGPVTALALKTPAPAPAPPPSPAPIVKTLPILAAIPAPAPDKLQPKIQVQPAVMTRTYPSIGAAPDVPTSGPNSKPYLNTDQNPEPIQNAIRVPTQISEPISHDIQVAALRSRAGAKTAYEELIEFVPQYKTQPYKIITANLGDKGIYYRLRLTGFSDAKTARSVCWELRAMGQDCFAVK